MNSLTKGISKRCKIYQGGISILYLFSFVKYSRSQIIREGLSLTSFPETIIYPFEGVNLVFRDSQTEDDGGKFFDENLNMDFVGIETNTELTKLVDKDYRVIIKDRNGNFRLLGAYNGMLTDLNETTGSTQAEFSGYSLTFEGKELQEALFIDNLEDAGFTISDENFLLLEDGTFILLEDGQKILVE